jgi:hypothetical protein
MAKRVRLVASSEPEVEYCYDRSGNIVSVMGKTCTTLDHVYPGRPENRNKHGVMKPNTRCYCGERRWGGTGLPIVLGGIVNTEPRTEDKKVFRLRIKRQAAEETDMAKKAAAAAKSTGRSWNRTYEFVKALKAEPTKGTIKAAVYSGIKSVKSGDADAVTAAAIKAGLKDATDQDPRVQTMVWLRNLIADGAVRVVKADGKSAAKAKTAPVAKKTVRVKLKKAS